MRNTMLVLVVTLFTLSACASVTEDIRVRTETRPGVFLGKYKTYQWLGSAMVVNDDRGRWEPAGFDADAEIRSLIDRQLRKQGIHTPSVNPDLIVGFAAGIDMDVLRVAGANDGVLQLENVPKGALVVVLLDAFTRQIVWLGQAEAEIQPQPDPAIARKRLDYAITKMLATFNP